MPLGENNRWKRGSMIQPALQAYDGDPSGYTRPPYVHRIAGTRTAWLAREPQTGRCGLEICQIDGAAVEIVVSLGPHLPCDVTLREVRIFMAAECRTRRCSSRQGFRIVLNDVYIAVVLRLRLALRYGIIRQNSRILCSIVKTLLAHLIWHLPRY